jgi:hypothetical protein
MPFECFINLFDTLYESLEKSHTIVTPRKMNYDPSLDKQTLFFEQKYYNEDMVCLLNEHTERMARAYVVQANYFAPYFSFVQSSGMGKSRSIYEMGAREHLTIYLCLRSEGSIGYPLVTFHPNYFSNWDGEKWAEFFVL